MAFISQFSAKQAFFLTALLSPTIILAEWSLVLEEEFEGNSLNSSLWKPRNNASHCCPQEPQLYLSDNIQVANGVLTITTREETILGPSGEVWNYTSGWVDTQGKFAQYQGRWEVTAKLPAADCWGAWPAHWLIPDDPSVCWPTGGEIDIMEAAMNGIYNPIASTYHWSEGECGADEHVMFGGLYPKRPSSPVFDWSSDFHTFAVDWTDSGLVYYMDDNIVYNISASECVMPPGPMYFILDTALAWGVYMPWAEASHAKLPCTHIIDSLRVYEWV